MLDVVIANSPLLYLTQSLWRDEVYSLFLSARPLSFIISQSDFEPPLYYFLLHYWTLIFGDSEIAGRSLSFLAFAGATYIMVRWAEKLFHDHWMKWYLPVFFFFNPMLLYYSMELRTYGWYMFFATLALWSYAQNKRKTWIIATILGFYIHSFFVIVPMATIIHYLVVHRKKLFSKGLQGLLSDSMMRAALWAGLGIAPWLLKILIATQKLQSSWYFPVDLNLITSVLGNLFIGYEGTPWYLWSFTKILSFIIVGFCIWAWRSKKNTQIIQLLLIQIFVPLFIVISISFIKPLYVNRYMIPVTIALVILISLAIYAIKNTFVQKIIGAVCLLFVLGFNIWYPNKHAKLDIRKTIQEINILKTTTDVVIAESPLIFFESIYYSTQKNQVYLYNPQSLPFPWYVGGSVVSASQMVSDFPPYPIRAFLVHQDGAFDIVYKASVTTKR